jgi:hypothetical protein
MTPGRKVAWVDGGFALMYATLFGCLVHASNEAVADTVRRYGYNVDSGALELMAAVVYSPPVALLFGLAAVSLWRGVAYSMVRALVCGCRAVAFVAR